MIDIKELVFKELEAQRAEFLATVYKHKDKWSEEECEEWLNGMVFEEKDILFHATKEFCEECDVLCINDIRDFQHATIDICLEEFIKIKKGLVK